MSDEKKTEQTASRDAWFIDKSINVSIPADMGREELLRTLNDNRANLENLKRDYCNAKNSNADQRKVLMYLHEIMRVVNAIEVIKNRLVLTGGQQVPLSDLDIEHPDDACNRFRKCYVITAAFGENSNEAIRVKRKCRRTFVLNPVMTLGWCVYQHFGPIIANWSQSSKTARVLTKKLLAEPIMGATNDIWIVSVACIVYLLLLSLVGLTLLGPSVLIGWTIRLASKRARGSDDGEGKGTSIFSATDHPKR